MSQMDMKRAQHTRVEKLAVNLKVMLKRYAQDEDGFQVRSARAASRTCYATVHLAQAEACRAF